MTRALLLAALLFAAGASPARAVVNCEYDHESFPGAPVPVLGDIDGDIISDIAVGLPGADEVLVRQSKAGRVVLRGGDGFGSAVATGDVDHDGCGDVAVGTPASGTVQIYRGSPDGLRTADPVTLTGAPGSGFGSAMVIAQDTGVWVGAPGAERVERFRVDQAGAATASGSYQAAAPVAGERFGSRLAPARKGILVGVPRRDGGRGAVERIRVGKANRVHTLAHARPGDRFGASVATPTYSSLAFAGAPGRDHGRGAVKVLGGRLYTEDTRGVPGRARRGHHFGASVAYGRALTCQEDGSVAAGVPGANAVTLISLDEHCAKRLTFPPAAGVGRALGIQRDRDDFDEDVYDTLLVGAPGTGRLHAGKHVYELPQTGRVVVAVAESGSALDA